jgi:hypothetical protein
VIADENNTSEALALSTKDGEASTAARVSDANEREARSESPESRALARRVRQGRGVRPGAVPIDSPSDA